MHAKTKHSGNFSGLKKGTFKNYIKTSKKIPSYYTPQRAAAFVLKNQKTKKFSAKTIKRARLVRMAGAKSRAKRATGRKRRRTA